MLHEIGQPELGFVLSDGEKFLKEESERGHIEVAFRILNASSRMKGRFERSIWAPDNPVDFLIFEEGAIKVGNRWGDTRIIQYYPYMLCRKVEEIFAEYCSLNYDVREVYLPKGIERNHFHW